MSTVSTSGSTTLVSFVSLKRRRERHSSFHAEYLLQTVHDIDQIALCRKHRVDVFVRRWQLVDDPRVLAALNACRLLREVSPRESALGLAARHLAPGPVAAGVVRRGIALAAHDERFRAHATGDDAKLSRAGRHRALAGD